MQSITGTGALNLRFPGQWFQLETGLHYNWHRSYDPTLGRYTQPDPLGFVDGPSVYGYAKGSPVKSVDPDGQGVFTDDPNATPLKELQCANLRTLTVLICKVIPNSCNKSYSCSMLQTKIDRKKNCIVSQIALTNYCYADPGGHEQRIEDQEKGIDRCKRLQQEKNCFVCSVK